MKQGTLQIFTAQSGRLSAKVIIDENTTRHIHSLVKPEVEYLYFADVSVWGELIVLLGTGLGYHLTDKIEQICSKTHIIIVEFYKELLDSCHRSLFKTLPQNLLEISQENYQTHRDQLINIGREFTERKIQIIKHPASYFLHKDFYDKTINDIFSNCKVLPGSSSKAGKVKKIIVPNGSFFLQREITEAILKTSIIPVPFPYEHIVGSANYESHLQKVIESQKPDLLFSINMKGFDGNGIISELTQRRSIAVAIWFVDDPHPILIHQAQFITPNMIALCWEKSYIPFLKKCGFAKVIWLPLATGLPLTESSQIKPRTQLGFVGTSMAGDFLNNIKAKFLWHETLEPIVEKVSDAILNQPSLNISHHIQQITHEVGITLPFNDKRNFTWLCSLIIHTASMKKRKHIIGSLMSYGVETFGDPKGWRQILGESLRTHSDIDYHCQLANVYRSIAVNVNITSCQMLTAVNQRVFDIPTSGSFVISDNQPDLKELFDEGKEAIVYENVDHLKELVNFYLTKEEARKRVIDKAQKRILGEHTYSNRLGTFLKAFGSL